MLMEKLKKKFHEKGYILGLVLLFIVFVFLYIRVSDFEEQNSNSLIDYYDIINVSSSDIQSFDYMAENGDEISFARNGDVWEYVPNPDMDIDQDGPTYIAELIKKITSEYQVTNPEDIGLYGLSNSSKCLHIVTKKAEYFIYIGNYNETVQRYYAYKEGDNTVYGVTEEIAELFTFTLDDFQAE